MGILKKLGIGAAVALACLVLAVLVLAQLLARWEARVQPLSLEEVRGLAAAAADRAQTNPERGGSEDADQPGRSGSRGRASDEAGADDAADSGGRASAAAETADVANRPEPKPPKYTRLAALPTKEQLDEFGQNFSGLELMRRRVVEGFVTKVLLSALGMVGVVDRKDVPGSIGRFYFDQLRDFDTARPWLADGIRVAEDGPWRRWLCSMQAWLVDDPQVAAALLEESLSGPLTGLTTAGDETPSVALNAVDLCVVTGSEDLAEYYYLRYHDVLRKSIEAGHVPWHLETRYWIQNFEHNADRTKKMWPE